jgi:hypothetical protein
MTTLNALGFLSFLFVVGFTWWAATRAQGHGQSPQHAILEAWKNIVIGFGLNLLANLVMIPLMSPGGHMTLMSNFAGGWVYTAVSLVRTYGIRRYENWRQHLRTQRMEGKAA